MRSQTTSHLLGALLCLILLPSCADGFGGAGEVNVSGTVRQLSFTGMSGTAERDGLGNYVVTLTDSPDFSCLNTPSSTYLKIAIGEFSQAGTFSAPGRVTFSSVSGFVDMATSATGGTVTILDIDTFDETITGELNAQSSDSSVRGTFSVNLCP